MDRLVSNPKLDAYQVIAMNLAKRPLVGFIGTHNAVAACRLEDRLVLQLRARSWWLIVIGSCIAGPLLAWRLWSPPGGFAAYPWPITAGVLILNVIFSYYFVLYLFRFPRVEVMCRGGDLRLFKWRYGPPFRTIGREGIDGFELGTGIHLEEGTRVINHILYVVTSQGERLALCGSVDEKLMVSLRAELAALTGKRSQ